MKLSFVFVFLSQLLNSLINYNFSLIQSSKNETDDRFENKLLILFELKFKNY